MEEENSNDQVFNVNDLGSMNSDKIKNPNNKIIFKPYFIISISIFIISIIIILLIILLQYRLNQNENDNKDETIKNKIGEINCILAINKINVNTQILGREFKKESDFAIIIDGKKLINIQKSLNSINLVNII